MARRASSLNNLTGTAISREIGSKYDLVRLVAENLQLFEQFEGIDVQALIDEFNEAKDFSGITVQMIPRGTPPSWDPETKVLRIPDGPRGFAGAAGVPGFIPEIQFSYEDGNLVYEVINLSTVDEHLIGEW